MAFVIGTPVVAAQEVLLPTSDEAELRHTIHVVDLIAVVIDYYIEISLEWAQISDSQCLQLEIRMFVQFSKHRVGKTLGLHGKYYHTELISGTILEADKVVNSRAASMQYTQVLHMSNHVLRCINHCTLRDFR